MVLSVALSAIPPRGQRVGGAQVSNGRGPLRRPIEIATFPRPLTRRLPAASILPFAMPVDEPLNPEFIEKLRTAGFLRLDDRALRHLKHLLEAVRDEAAEPDQDPGWVRVRFDMLEAFNDTFWMISEKVESPIEQLLGAHLIFISDGYNEVRPDFFPGAFPDPDSGTYFRCQQRFREYRLDFLFKLCLQGDYRLLAVECDGHDFHERTKEQAARDRSRDRMLFEAGVPVIRFTGSEIYRDPQRCANEVTNHLAALNRDLLAAHGLERPRRQPAVPD